MICIVCFRDVPYNRRDLLCDECRNRPPQRRPSALAPRREPKVTLADITAAFDRAKEEL
jgi:hypothetical protein